MRSGWEERNGKLPKGRGLGMACSHYVSGAANSIIRSDMPHSTVNIKIDRDGGVVVYTGASEIGQGSDTMTAQVVAEVLGCSLARVQGDCCRYRPDADRSGLVFQSRDLYGRQCGAARSRKREEEHRQRGGQAHELRAGRRGYARRSRVEARG